MSDLASAFFGPGNELALGAIPAQSLIQVNEWIRLLESPDRTSFLPREFEGRLFWYVFTPSDRRANEILDLLSAWIGPTYSDIATNRGRINLADPFDSKVSHLAQMPMLKFEVLPRTGHPDPGVSKRYVREALVRLTTLLDSRPASEFQLPRSTPEILDDLGHAVSASDLDAVDNALDDLAQNGDLDTVNLSFIKVRTLASFGDWDALLDDRSIDDLLQVARPPGVTRALRRAFFHRYFASLATAEKDVELLGAARDLDPEIRSLAQGPSPKHPDELFYQVLLALTSEPPLPRELAERMVADSDELRMGLRPRLLRVIATAASQRQGPPVDLHPEAVAFALYAAGDSATAFAATLELPLTSATARLAILCAADIDERPAAERALSYLSAEPNLRDDLTRSKQIRTALSGLEQLVESEQPSDWPSWLDQVSRGGDAASAIDATPRDFEQWSPMEFTDLAARIEAMKDDSLMVFGEISGPFLAAHREVIDEAGASGTKLARQLLAALAVSLKASAGVRTQTLNLIDLAFSGSFTGSEYSDIIGYLRDIRTTNSSAGTAEWQADLFQAVTSYPRSTDSTGSMDQFVSDSLQDFIAFRYGLSLASIRAIKIVCDEYPLDFPSVLADLIKDSDQEAQRFSYLAGKSVAIYSLMESAAGRAAQVLRSLVPSIDLKLFSDKAGGAARLMQASSSADIFVIVTAAAKHAVTEFIEAKRGNGEIVRVNAKGTSAILNALRRED